MGASLNSYRIYLKRVLKETISEIFDSQPIMSSFNFTKEGDDITTDKFKDYKGNNVQILFYKIKENIYELDFTVNGNSFNNDDINYTVKDYSILLNTVAKAVSQFLTAYNPQIVFMDGYDSERKKITKPYADGQKNRLYNYFISQLEPNDNYKVDKTKFGTINLARKNGR
jgi:hypothetical protein